MAKPAVTPLDYDTYEPNIHTMDVDVPHSMYYGHDDVIRSLHKIDELRRQLPEATESKGPDIPSGQVILRQRPIPGEWQGQYV